ncbi:hypothetical protein V1478_000812, partial [Vespula squamosa]
MFGELSKKILLKRFKRNIVFDRSNQRLSLLYTSGLLLFHFINKVIYFIKIVLKVGPIKSYKPNQCNFTERSDEKELIVKLPEEKFQKFYALTSIIMQQASKC